MEAHYINEISYGLRVGYEEEMRNIWSLIVANV
jgi:hypothetical protein